MINLAIPIPSAPGQQDIEIEMSMNGIKQKLHYRVEVIRWSECQVGLESEDRVLFRYCEPDGQVTERANPNGSKGNVAGVLGEAEHVAVLMPHPERVTLPDIGPTDGQGILRGFA